MEGFDNNPQAANKALANLTARAKIEKLVASAVVPVLPREKSEDKLGLISKIMIFRLSIFYGMLRSQA